MQRKVLIVVCLFGLTGLASATVNIIGYLRSEDIEPVQVDSVYMLGGLTGSWFPTPGWTVNAGETDTFEFPEYPEWPSTIKVAAFIAGIPILYTIDRPRPDSWYSFEPPFEQVQVQFHPISAIEEGKRPYQNAALFPPTIVNNQRLYSFLQNHQIEIITPTGQIVRNLPLAPGIYFCRLANTTSQVQKLTIIR
ncbi:MAG: hypothetical protein ABIK42_00665 [candidate division WOR-3 bacterium]